MAVGALTGAAATLFSYPSSGTSITYGSIHRPKRTSVFPVCHTLDHRYPARKPIYRARNFSWLPIDFTSGKWMSGFFGIELTLHDCKLDQHGVMGAAINASNYQHDNFLCTQKNCNDATFRYFDPAKKFSTSCYSIQFHCLLTSSRHCAIKSVYMRSGSSDVTYPLSGPELNAKARGVCFYTVTAIVAIFFFVLMAVGHPFVLMFDRHQRKFHHFIAKMWATLTIRPFFKVEYEGFEHLPGPGSPVVYVSNHQSFLDIYALLTLGRSFKFISKTSIFVYPVVGWAMYLMGVIRLKRMDRRSQLECLKRCMYLIKGGASVFFFPEGTRSKDGKLGVFKKGAFSVAAKTGVPVVPITIIGTGNIMPAGMEGLLNPGSVKVIIHRALVGNDAEELCREARRSIAKSIVCLS